MVDPDDVTKFDRTRHQLEEFLLFCVVVAGKTAHIQTRKLEDWLKEESLGCETPFGTIFRLKTAGRLRNSIKKAKLGQYNRLVRCFDELQKSKFDLTTCTTSDLESITGIGPKTSRFFVLHSRPGQRIAVLDTHILSWMREKGVNAPARTPQGTRQYAELESRFMSFCDELGKTPEQLDLEIWSARARRAHSVA